MKSKPELQIQVPCYNEKKNITNFLNSLREQTFENFEVLIHDNCSTDGTAEICKDFCEADNRFKLNVIKPNIHLINQMVRIKFGCTCDYVAQLSVNDRISGNFLQELMDPIRSNARIAISYSHGYLLNQGVEIDPGNASKIDTSGMDTVGSAFEVMSKYTQPYPLWGIYRREVFEQCRPMQFVYGGDHIFVAEASLYGEVVPTISRTNWRVIGEKSEQVGIEHNVLIQHEAHVRNIHPTSFFYGVQQKLPFLNMVCGHVEMFTYALISEEKKYKLINAAFEIMKSRFGKIIEIEIDTFIQIIQQLLNNVIKNTENYDPIIITMWIEKIRQELHKIKIYQKKIGNDYSNVESIEKIINMKH
jgi:glycosyltransferase involved in cell wall biosynthesis